MNRIGLLKMIFTFMLGVVYLSACAPSMPTNPLITPTTLQIPTQIPSSPVPDQQRDRCVDMIRGEISGRIPFADQPIRIARGLALTPNGTKLFISDYYSMTVAVIDTATNTVIARIPIDNPPSEIKVSLDGKRVYVLERSGMTFLSIFDAETYALLRKLTWSVSHPIDFELSLDERYIYFADFDPNYLYVYDLQEDKIVKIIKTGLDPFNMASTLDKKLIYMTNFTSDSISIFDTRINQIVDTIILH
jgi:YVTN family beta-propeller protein